MKPNDQNHARPLRVSVTVTTRAHEDRVEDHPSLDPTHRLLQAWVTDPPTDGRANHAVIDLVAHHFGVAPSLVQILRGHRSRRKLLVIANQPQRNR